MIGLKVILVFAIFCIALYGIDQTSWMFNHPWFVGEDALAIIVGMLITLLTITAIRIILFTRLWPPFKPIPVHIEAENEPGQHQNQKQEEETND